MAATTASIRFNVEGPFLDNRTLIRRFTNEDQQIDYPGDEAFKFRVRSGQPGDRVGQGWRLERRRRGHRWRPRRWRQRRPGRAWRHGMRNKSLQTPARKPDWLFRLEATIGGARGREFAWGAHDCCLFPCDVVLAMTGVDLAAGFRGRYRSLRTALRTLESAGGVEGIAEAIARKHGLEEVAPGLARRGDVILVDVGTSPSGCCRFELGPGDPACLAVVGMTGALALAAGRDGLVDVPMPFWRRAWRIG
jgi:hypothetical protein